VNGRCENCCENDDDHLWIKFDVSFFIEKKIVLSSTMMQKKKVKKSEKTQKFSHWTKDSRNFFIQKRFPQASLAVPLPMNGFRFDLFLKNARKMCFARSGNSIVIIIHVMLFCCLFDVLFCYFRWISLSIFLLSINLKRIT
jgi:hypothetical protein